MSPVDAHPPNSQGFYDVFGNAWEWTVDYFCALPGFKVHKFYEDFSTPCFDGLHNVIQGSSFVSSGNLASHFSRYHFRPHFLQHSSFRLSSQPADVTLATSDTDAPGPYVGRYPYRRSQAALQAAADGQTHAAETSAYSNLAFNFGRAIRMEFGLPNYNSPFDTLRDIVVSHARNLGLNAKESNVLGAYSCLVGC